MTDTEQKLVSLDWVLFQLAGMKFPDVGGAREFIKKAAKAAGVFDVHETVHAADVFMQDAFRTIGCNLGSVAEPIFDGSVGPTFETSVRCTFDLEYNIFTVLVYDSNRIELLAEVEITCGDSFIVNDVYYKLDPVPPYSDGPRISSKLPKPLQQVVSLVAIHAIRQLKESDRLPR